MWFIIILIIVLALYYLFKKGGLSFLFGKATYFGHSEGEVLKIIEDADQGDYDATSKLGILFDNGLTSDRHNELRRKIYYPKALQGEPNAEYWMGFLTNMIDHDAESSLQWYKKSASHGNIEAMRDLSFRYSKFANEPDSGITGFGVNREKEIYWQKRAAQLGDQKSQCSMGLDCMSDQKLKESIYWYELASIGADPDIRGKAFKALSEIYMGNRYQEYKDLIQAMEYTKRVLALRNEADQMESDYDHLYRLALSNFGYMNLRSYKANQSQENLRNAVYSFMLLKILGETYVDDFLKELPYRPSQYELDEWTGHAREMMFIPPFPNALVNY